jgi:hypothetical protein
MRNATSKEIKPYILGTSLIATALLIASGYSTQLASAQSATSSTSPSVAGSFGARGYMGILILSPQTIQALPGAAQSLVGSVIGGNWSFDVSQGHLQNFNINLNRLSLAGQNTGTITINGLSNATGAVSASPTNAILLQNGNSVFQGTANIDVNGTAKWKNVPMIVDLINGKLVNISFDNAKTDYQFLGTPLFGIVTSLTPKGL